eukprot:9582105-Prorocentrum_lima.AAC.1
MTSSLVGSEMCIRDRSHIRDANAKQSPDRAFRSGERLKSTPLLYNHFMPVSYTHLTLPTICSV